MTLEKFGKKEFGIYMACFLGITLRFGAMSIGHNFDFESYCGVGEMVTDFRNIYAEGARYNYAPLFSFIQGALYGLAKLFSTDVVLTFRVLIVGILTLTDLEIMRWLSERYSLKLGIIFFLNPVSIIITGFHNQFDNIPILFVLYSCFFYNEKEDFEKNDLFFILFMTLSLMTKHIFYVFPFWILVKKGLPFKKKLLYSFCPPLIFLLSFVPYVFHNPAALEGVISNVFLYRSFNNAPLLKPLFQVLGISDRYWFLIYLLIMIIIAGLVCEKSYEYQVEFYLLAMVAFSSAIANQYLAIPIVALCVLSKGLLRNIYFILVGIFLALSKVEFGLSVRIAELFPHSFLADIADKYEKSGYYIAVWILFVLIIKELFHTGAEKIQRKEGLGFEDKAD